MSILEQAAQAEDGKKNKTSIRQSWFEWVRWRFLRKTIALEYKYWQSDLWFVGFLIGYSDYWTQGKTLEELKENLTDIYNQVNDPKSLLPNRVHDELSLDGVPKDHKTDELFVKA